MLDAVYHVAELVGQQQCAAPCGIEVHPCAAGIGGGADFGQRIDGACIGRTGGGDDAGDNFALRL